jgi:membrane-bound lytic murein transglycosylase B
LPTRVEVTEIYLCIGIACIGRRQDYFRNEFFAIMELLSHGDVTPDEAKGSWAGAFGPTQFMPTVYKSYAVDADGDESLFRSAH